MFPTYLFPTEFGVPRVPSNPGSPSASCQAGCNGRSATNREMTFMKSILTKSTLVLSLVVCMLAGAAQAAEWGTLTGRFVIDGEAPKPTKINADKDVEVCGKHDLFNEGAVVGKDGGVQNVVIYLNT